MSRFSAVRYGGSWRRVMRRRTGEASLVKVIEYRLAKDTTEKTFLKASATLMPEIKRLKGFFKRELHKGRNGRWRDIVYWKRRKDADRSEREIPQLPKCMDCIALMDGNG